MIDLKRLVVDKVAASHMLEAGMLEVDFIVDKVGGVTPKEVVELLLEMRDHQRL